MTRGDVKSSFRGATLLEVVVGVSMLAVVIPMVGSAMLQSGLSSRDAKAETHSGWMVPRCLDEWRHHQSNEKLEVAGDALMLAFDRHGRLLGSIDDARYESGLRSLDGQVVFYVARLEERSGVVSGESMLHITIEYPSALSVSRRSVVPFETQIE